MFSDSQVSRIDGTFNRLQGEMRNLYDLFDRIAEQFYPQRFGFQAKEEIGAPKRSKQFDSTGTTALFEMAGSIETMLMPKDYNWFEVEPEVVHPDADSQREENIWLYDSSEKTIKKMYNPRAGFQNCISQALLDLIAFGVCVIYRHMNYTQDGLMYRCIHPKNAVWTYEDTFNVRNIYVKRVMDVQTAIDMYPNMPEAARRDLASNPSAKTTLIHAVEKNSNYIPGDPRASKMRWKSTVIDTKYDAVVHTGGHKTNPYIVSIWLLMDNYDIWSPGRFALPDVAVLNQQARTILKSANRIADPPILYPDGGITSPLRLIPGGVSTYNAESAIARGNRPIVEKIDVGGNLPVTIETMQMKIEQIKVIFWNHILRLPEKYMSATEVLRYNDDFQRITQSPLGRFETSLTEPLASGSFDILLSESINFRFGRGSYFAPPPETLSERTLNFKFNNPLTRARIQAKLARLAQTLEMNQLLIQHDPTVLDNIDGDYVFRTAAGPGSGFDPNFLKPLESVEKKRKATEQAMQMRTGAETADIGSRAVKNVAMAQAAVEGEQ